ncbi:MAG: 3D-(3,5/4)-trihydroxycyclohexane-1,2-dione acylhydrolase (decyclizing) [Firmicutes bacterium]|nr:3D-(3,5/4)-trihydroxycyclohexane-1,2-dione acylhydrolase (decyclizing) [Bacillota bacterium]
MTVAQALVRFLDHQYISFDGREMKFVEGISTIFGHGIALGIGQAMDQDPGQLKLFQGRNEQGMCHMAIGFAKQNNRRRIIACASSVGPGAANMVTAAATATVNNIPLLLFPADTFASRQPDPVLQQLEQSFSLAVTTNDAFRPVCKYWDRITRPEHLMTALINAMRVLTDPAETGAVCIALCQDVEGEAYDYPEDFFKRRVHRITRPAPVEEELHDIASVVSGSRHPLVIVGGGVKYSEAGAAVQKFCERYSIPFGETQAGKSACSSDSLMCLGGIGTTGTLAANRIAKKADCVIAIGTRLEDFTTGSKWQFRNPDVRFVTININRYHAYKMDAVKAVGDALMGVTGLSRLLKEIGYRSAWRNEIRDAKTAWLQEVQRLAGLICDSDAFEPEVTARDPRTIPEYRKLTGSSLTQTAVLCRLRQIIDDDAILVTAGGSLPSDLQRLWTTNVKDTYHAEYGYSCMGYEVAAALGAKLAQPDREVYAVLGDGSFQMLHSEIMTTLQEGVKTNLLIFDNCGFGCINNLQMSNGVGSIATEFRYRDDAGHLAGDLIPVDFAMIASGYGFKAYTCRNLEEFENAVRDARGQSLPCLFHLKIVPKTMTDGYESWWNIGIAEETDSAAGKAALEDVLDHRRQARKY